MSGQERPTGPSCTASPAGCLIWLGLLLVTAVVLSWVAALVQGALR